MPVDKSEILKKALMDIKGLARQLKGQGLNDKYNPAPMAEADEGSPDEEALDATEADPTMDPNAPPDDAPDDAAPTEEPLDEDKIAQLVAMLGKK